MQATAIAGVLFDKDGTLLDFQRTWAPLGRRLIDQLSAGDAALAARLAAGAGFDIDRDQYLPHSPLASGDGGALIRAWAAALPDQTEASLKALIAKGALGVIEGGLVPAVADLGGLLRRLKGAGLTLGLATHDLSLSAKAQLQRLGLADLFSFIAGADSGHGLKPDPAMLTAFCAASGLDPGAVAVVGDSAIDLEMGRRGGAGLVAAVLTGPAPRAALAPLADVVLDDIDALPGCLGLLS